MSEGFDSEEAEAHPVRRALEAMVFSPFGIAVTVAEDLPGIVAKGRQVVETEISNARVVGKFVIEHGQREIVSRLGSLLGRTSPTATPTGTPTATGTGTTSAAPSPAPDPVGAPAATPAPAPAPAPVPPPPPPDPADAALVEQALAGYDTLSASQVVRRLESLGNDELRAVHRHEASHRNRRTILNRTNQLLAGDG